MLLSAGIPLPEAEFVHGYINIAGAKMSKSLGNTIDPAELVQTYGRDAVRYFLLRGISATRDADFVDVDGFHDQLRSRYNADLANDLGNLVNRTVTMVGRFGEGAVPAPGNSSRLDSSVRDLANEVGRRVQNAMQSYNPQLALEAIWELVTRANKYVEETAPWTLSKVARDGDKMAAAELERVLFTLAESVRIIGTLLEPFIPDTAERIRQQLGVAREANTTWTDTLRWGQIPPATRVASPQPLFPRLELAV
jgi:methionyl-tRNA synthetase